jgi:hypothetical protein
MKILEYHYYNEESLIEKLRQVKIKDTNYKIYENCDISIKIYDKYSKMIYNNNNYDIVKPCQFYVLQRILDRVKDLQDELWNIGIPIHNIAGYGTISTIEDGALSTFDYLPPVIEKCPLTNEYLICDGMHRMTDDNLSVRRFINVAVIENLPAEWPYYALPNTNGWSDVKVLEEVPANKDDWKLYREPYPQCKRFFRDFNSVFNGVTKQRGK